MAVPPREGDSDGRLAAYARRDLALVVGAAPHRRLQAAARTRCRDPPRPAALLPGGRDLAARQLDLPRRVDLLVPARLPRARDGAQRRARAGRRQPRDAAAVLARRRGYKAGSPRLRPPRGGLGIEAARPQRRHVRRGHAVQRRDRRGRDLPLPTDAAATRDPRPRPGSRGRAGRLSALFGQLFLVVVRAGLGDERGLDALLDRLLRDRALDDVLARRELEHHVEQGALDDRAQSASAGLALESLLRDLRERLLGEDELDRVVGEEALVLAHEGVLGLGQDLDEIVALELVHGRDDRQAADELRDQPVGEQVFRHHLREHLRGLVRVLRADLGAESHRVLPDPLADDLLQVGERAAADEEDVRRVDREELLVRVLAPALGRHRRHRSLEDLQQRLLDPLAGDVARDGRVVRLARDLVDLVDVDDSGLRLLDVEVSGLDQLQEDVLDVLADVAGFGQRGRVGERERHVEDARQRLRQQRLPAAGRAEQEDVRLLQLDVVLVDRHLHALVVVVDGDGQRAFGLFLRDDVVVEDGVDVLRAREVLEVELGGSGQLLIDDLVAEVDALVADIDPRPCDELLDLPLALATKTAEQLLVSVGCSRHLSLLLPRIGPKV